MARRDILVCPCSCDFERNWSIALIAEQIAVELDRPASDFAGGFFQPNGVARNDEACVSVKTPIAAARAMDEPKHCIVVLYGGDTPRQMGLNRRLAEQIFAIADRSICKSLGAAQQ